MLRFGLHLYKQCCAVTRKDVTWKRSSFSVHFAKATAAPHRPWVAWLMVALLNEIQGFSQLLRTMNA
ncbi:hypothetical protein D3C81_1699710 [compost metagenome]